MAVDYSGLGGAVGSIFSGIGGIMSAGGYAEGARLAHENADLTKLSTGIQVQQKTRQEYKILGATEAAAAGNNLSLTGSAMDVLRENKQQTAMEKSLTELQGTIDFNSWQEKAAADQGASDAAMMGGIGSIVGGVFGAVGAFL